MEEKVCTKCGVLKPFSEFYKAKRNKRGLQVWCKFCMARARSVWQKANPEKHRQHTAAWQKANPEKVHQKYVKWRKANLEKARQYEAAWKKANPAKRRQSRQYRQASKLRATPAWADKKQILAVYAEAVRRMKAEGIIYHVDHIVPLQSRLVCGLHVPANLQVLEAKKNISKGNRVWPDMP